MGKTLKLIINLFIFVMIAGFIAYMVTSVNDNEETLTEYNAENSFKSSYKKAFTIDIMDTVSAFEMNDTSLFILSKSTIKINDKKGNHINSFAVKPNARDIKISQDLVFLLYPTFFDVYSLSGNLEYSWEACSELSDYCSFTITDNFVFVTDAENKNICKYTKEGNFMAFIQSPHGFITPSHAFDITSKNDTIYCVNPGRHLIESYSLDGEFLSAFGGSGMEAGFFSGCCNPAYISLNENGNIFTSEKGMPRICYYNSNGKLIEVMLNSRLLGGGHQAYEIKANKDTLYVASINKIDMYTKTDR